jgi:O-antigen/teichoic acid export membrane protein
LRILLLGQAANVATGSVGFILIMTGYTLLDLIDNALGIGLMVALAIGLTSAFGIEGTAAAAALSIATLNVVRLAQVRRRLGIQPYERGYVRLALPATGAALAAVGAQWALSGRPWWASLAATGVCGLTVYLALLPFGLPAEERAVVSRRLRSLRTPNLAP